MEDKIFENQANESVMKMLKDGMTLFENNKIDESFKLFDSAIKLDPTYADAYIIKGEALMKMFDMEEAEKFIMHYLQLIPDNLRAYEDLMNIHYETGEFDKSLVYCNKLLKRDTENPNFFARKAFLLGCLNDVDQAIECYDKAIELKPDFYDAICDKGNLLSECNCNKEALQAYKQAILVDSNKAEAYMGASFAYYDMGHKKKAREYSAKAKQLEPDDDFYEIHNSIMKQF